MTTALVADRFFQHDDRTWTDLATGAAVEVRVEHCSEDWMAVDAACRREAHGPTPRLIDWGRIGLSGWFEARYPGMADVDAADRRAAALVSAIESLTSPGVHHVDARHLAPPLDLAAVLARRWRSQGMLALRPGIVHMTLPPAWLLHRHIALLILADDDLAPGTTWMHALSRISARTHLVVDLRGARDGRPRPPLARDRMEGWCPDRCTSSTVRLRRAAAATLRRRPAEAERWARAALESARRHADDDGQVQALGELVGLLLGRDDYVEALRVATEVVERLQGRVGWLAAAPVLAGVLRHRGELARAEALLTTVASHAAITGAAAPSAAGHEAAWLRFWQGRFEEFTALVSTLPASRTTSVLAGVAAWVTQDRSRMRQAATALCSHGRDDTGAMLWSRIFTALAFASAHADDERLLEQARAILLASVRVHDVHAVRLARAFAADLLMAADRRDEGRRALGAEADWARASVLEQWLERWLRAAGDFGARARLQVLLKQAGALGIRRWGSGRDTMQLAHEIPAVLQLVEEAEDEVSALARGCQWLRRTAQASAVAILAAEDLAVVVADGWSAADTAALTPSPATMEERCVALHEAAVVITLAVRHAGRVIGWLVARGPTDRAGTLRDLGRMLAAICASPLQGRLDALATARRGTALTPEILGGSPAMVALRDSVARAAATRFPVLIEGESGTGKELVARAIHRLGARRDRKLSAVNCAALSDELVEAELFGHVRGAFTGALTARIGLFEEASGGSLFLDEVSELSPRAQAKLLRVLQEREVRRVGENVPRPIDVRVIAATNQPLADACARGVFRPDLLFRLAVIRIRTTPLRERPEDIPVLARSMWRSLTLEAGRRVVLGPDALAALCRHAWPGNVREFQNVLAALLVVAPARGRIGTRHVQQVLASGSEVPRVASLQDLRLQFERRAISMALARHGGRRAAAARELGLSRQGLVKAIRRLGLGELADGSAEGVA